jgi:hypothetical protein
LVQLIGVKILATSLCRASGLVGGYYAPSLFIGAATGMAYGKFMKFTFTGPEPLLHVPFLDVASPQAYGLVTCLPNSAFSSAFSYSQIPLYPSFYSMVIFMQLSSVQDCYYLASTSLKSCHTISL